MVDRSKSSLYNHVTPVEWLIYQLYTVLLHGKMKKSNFLNFAMSGGKLGINIQSKEVELNISPFHLPHFHMDL